MAQEYKIVKGFNTEAGLGIYDYDSLANKPNIEGMIQDALEEFVPPVDNTLKNEGQAADAKVTGEAISELESKIGSEPVSTQIEQAEQRVSERIEQAIEAIPPNQPLKFEGAIEATYNGSAPIAVAIPIIDDSLEVEGNAADAKATGEAIDAVLKQMDEDIDKATNAILKKMDEEVGSATKTYVDEKFDNIEIPEIPEIPEFSGFIAQPEAPTQYNVLWIDTNDESIDSEIGNIEQIDAWTLQGKLPSYFASKEFVQKEIADAQLDDKEVDLSSYYTKSEVDSKIENIQLKEGPQGEPGVSGVWVGVDEPVDDDYQVWINPEGSAYKELQRPIVEHETGSAIGLNDASDMKLAGLRIFGKTTQNGTPTPEAPVPMESVGDGGSIRVSVTGKNLLKHAVLSRTTNGVTFTVNDDGSITVSGTATAMTDLYLFGPSEDNMVIVPPGEYIISKAGSSGGYYLFGTGQNHEHQVGGSDTRVTTNNGYSWGLYRILKGKTVNETIYPMIRLASMSDASYEPYKEAQSLSVSTPNGLPGIPVTSGGNYTDENGQQWACDEVDFARGVYIQNVQKVILDGMESWRTYGTFGYYFEFADIESIDSPMGVSDGSKSEQRLMCSHFAVQPKYVNIADRKHGMTVIYCSYNSGKCRIAFDLEGTTMATYAAEQYAAGNPVTVLYQRAVPIETALSEEELTAYAALYTNYPNTTVFNDGGAGMEVKYVADTKLYIDKKFDQLAQAMLNQ